MPGSDLYRSRRSSLIRTSALMLFSTLLCAPAFAEKVGPTYGVKVSSSDAHLARHLTISVGKSVIVDLPRPASEVFVSDPQIANAVVRSSTRLYIIGATSGHTSIFAMDQGGHKIAVFDVHVGRDMNELRRILSTALPGNDIHVSTVKDTVILTGTVDSAVEAQKAADIAQAFVGYAVVGGGGSSGGASSTNISLGQTQIVKGSLINSLVIRGKEQVMLRVTVAEVQRNVIKQLGISENGSWGGSTVSLANMPGMSTQPASYLGTTTSAAGVVSGFIGGAGGAEIGGAGSLLADVQAFERNGVARVLAEPTVTAISGESATFMAGGTIPVTTQSSINPQTGVCTVTTALTPYGVTLNFTPTVLSGGRISLHLATEVTEIDGMNAVQYGCSNAIGFRTRKNETTVELPSGGSIMSAGLIQQTNKQVIAGVPGLMDLPILGTLFRSRDYQRQETELVVIVTPYIAKTLRPDQIARPDDGFADASDPESMFLGRVNRIYSSTQDPNAMQNFKGDVGFIQN